MKQADGKIGPQILNALRDCKTFRRGTYCWKRASMTKAVALGLAEEVPNLKVAFQSAFILTEAGIKAIEASQ